MDFKHTLKRKSSGLINSNKNDHCNTGALEHTCTVPIIQRQESSQPLVHKRKARLGGEIFPEGVLRGDQ